jgi:plasmid stabilization system protein ParE
MKHIYLGPRLGRDIEKAADYYEMESAALAMRFMGALGDAVRLLRAHPRIGSPLIGAGLGIPNIRAITPHAFPYLLFYTEYRGRLILIRLLHMSRNLAIAFRRR